MKLKPMTCPNCSGNIKKEGDEYICENCGSVFCDEDSRDSTITKNINITKTENVNKNIRNENYNETHTFDHTDVENNKTSAKFLVFMFVFLFAIMFVMMFLEKFGIM